MTHGYHAHIYFDLTEAERAEGLRRSIALQFGEPVTMYPLVPRLVGPQPRPMFEINFEEADHATVVPWLEQHRAGLTVLVHPVTGDDLADHTDLARWLGPPEGLFLDRL